MADRFTTTIKVGGEITMEVLEGLKKIVVDDCLEGDDEESITTIQEPGEYQGYWYVHEVNNSDFENFRSYCVANKISYSIQWQAKYEYDGYLDIWTPDQCGDFNCIDSGEPCYLHCDLEMHDHLTVREFLNRFSPPFIPKLTIRG